MKRKARFVLLCSIVFCFVALFLGFVYNYKYGFSLSLPSIKEELIGRGREMQQILEVLKKPDVDVLNLYGLPGVGKSTIAKHIGHAMLKQGTDVHYILMEYVCVGSLEWQLCPISGCKGNITVAVWARNCKKNTLIIMDKMNGRYWTKHSMLAQLQKRFIHPLLSNSKNIKLLTTSTKIMSGL